jgi:hypothetical protein
LIETQLENVSDQLVRGDHQLTNSPMARYARVLTGDLPSARISAKSKPASDGRNLRGTFYQRRTENAGDGQMVSSPLQRKTSSCAEVDAYTVHCIILS